MIPGSRTAGAWPAQPAGPPRGRPAERPGCRCATTSRSPGR
ncbi:hypothetical protein I551_3575 [Mycobacterium ulcerans str. Harvey]|uniref:Uncharacterized protein n=1 Tax=Mycobacterium ulcerans str. Harvey TaxID=1299332 RepID=A0ABN0QYG6_MYCUL|nr:hypothetical protein I551_3575 [Mycobacterium ulcerans str. Harvey]